MKKRYKLPESELDRNSEPIMKLINWQGFYMPKYSLAKAQSDWVVSLIYSPAYKQLKRNQIITATYKGFQMILGIPTQ